MNEQSPIVGPKPTPSRRVVWMVLVGVLVLLTVAFFGLKFYKIDIAKFFAAGPVTRVGMVYVQGSKLMLDGQEYRVKGMMTTAKYHRSFEKLYPYPTDFPPGSSEYCQQYANSVPQIEGFSHAMLWNDFDASALEAEFTYYADVLHVNTLRILTPNPNQMGGEVQWHCWQKWFQADGSINPVYRDRLLQFITIARRHGIRIYLGLIADGKESDWECRDATAGWQSCNLSGVESIVASTGDSTRVRFIRPGSVKEAFYLQYLRSLIPYLKNETGLFAYEVGNENLQYWPLNGADKGSANSWYQEQVLSFQVRMIKEIKRLDLNHLVGTGEAGLGSLPPTYWAYPTAELGAVADIDYLGTSELVIRLESFVDFIGVHVYNYTVQSSALPAFVDAIRARSGKPIVFGEFNYFTDYSTLSDPRIMQSPSSARKAYYELAASLTETGTSTGAKTSGFILYLPIPPMDFPGGYTLSDLTWSGSSVPRKGIIVNGPPQRKIVDVDLRSSMFMFDATKRLNLGWTPEAQYFAELWNPVSTTRIPSISISPTPTSSVSTSPSATPTFLIDGALVSTHRQLETFTFSGSGLTPAGTVERWVRTVGTEANVKLAPNYPVSSQGMVSWLYTASCTTPPVTSVLWLVDVSTGKKSPEVTEIVNQHPKCNQTTPTPTLNQTGGTNPGQYGLNEGDPISATNSLDPDIYIINQNGYKRLFLNPIIFSFYDHLGGFQNVKAVSTNTRDVFTTSLYFKNCETNDPKVYAVQVTGEDTGVLHWLNLSQDQATQQDPAFNQKIFCINNNEYAWYPKGSEYTSLTQVPLYQR